jgi:hypothetical protein
MFHKDGSVLAPHPQRSLSAKLHRNFTEVDQKLKNQFYSTTLNKNEKRTMIILDVLEKVEGGEEVVCESGSNKGVPCTVQSLL